MMDMRIVAVLLLGLVIVTAPACAQSKLQNQGDDPFQHGLWACKGFAAMVIAQNLDEEFAHVSKEMEFSYSVAEQISNHVHGGAGESCARINSDELKPIKHYDTCGTSEVALYVTDGKNEGWVGIRSYFKYMRFHVVQSASR